MSKSVNQFEFAVGYYFLTFIKAILICVGRIFVSRVPRNLKT